MVSSRASLRVEGSTHRFDLKCCESAWISRLHSISLEMTKLGSWSQLTICLLNPIVWSPVSFPHRFSWSCGEFCRGGYGLSIRKMNRSQQPYRLPSSVHGFSHGLTNSPPDCLLPSLRSGRPFESRPTYAKNPIPRWVSDFLVRRKGLEPLTYWFVASHSIQLSYRRISTPKCLGIITHTVKKSKYFFEKINIFLFGRKIAGN